jgi:hypothetical protein
MAVGKKNFPTLFILLLDIYKKKIEKSSNMAVYCHIKNRNTNSQTDTSLKTQKWQFTAIAQKKQMLYFCRIKI